MNMHTVYAYLNTFLLSNLASYQSMTIDTKDWYEGVDPMDDTTFTDSLGILTSSVARNNE